MSSMQNVKTVMPSKNFDHKKVEAYTAKNLSV